MNLLYLLERYLKDQFPDWVPKGNITAMTWESKNGTTFLPETVGRTLRTLEADSKIAVKYIGKNTLYKHIPNEMRRRYIPSSQREGEQLFVKV